MKARTSWFSAFVMATLGGAVGSCSQQTAINLTIDSQFVYVAGRAIDQLSIVLSGPWGAFEPLVTPTAAGADLGESETLNIVVSAGLAGQMVDIDVQGLYGGAFVASGSTAVVPNLGEVVNATVVLSLCEALDGPFCEPSEDVAFCGGEILVTCDPVTEGTVRTCCDPYACNPDRLACDSCNAGTTECNGNILIMCGPEGLIESSMACDPGICLVDRCVACDPSTVECRLDIPPAVSGSIITCDMDGTITDQTACPYGCGGKPISCYACAPGMMQCLTIGPDDYIIDCTVDGMVATMMPCNYGCDTATNACNACTPDATGLSPECQMDDLVTCDASGGVVATDPCTAFGCNTTVDPDACNSCDPDPTISTQCIGDLEVTCSTGGQIVTSVDCATLGTTCNVATGSCNNCTPGTSFCSGLGDVAMCDASGNPTVSMTCTYGCSEPVPGMPVCNGCVPGETACQGTDLVVCDAGGSVVSTLPCTYGCYVEAGATADRCNACNPGTTECQGTSLVVCTPDGFVATTTPCSYGCDSSPTPPVPDRCYECTPGTTECQGSSYVTCSATGTITGSTSCGTLTNQCNTGACTPTGCMATPVANGTICNDLSFCSVGDVCTAGLCGGSPRNCTDSNPCTFDACDELNDMCVGDPAPNIGLACDDTVYCTTPDACNSMGVCTGPLRGCNDMNPCTLDTCNVVMDACVSDPVPLNGMACDDSLFCTTGTTCSSGTCLGGAGTCNDGNACTTDTCDESTDTCGFTPVANGTTCSDGLFCTISDNCQAGACVTGGPRDCSDIYLCNTDSCNEAGDTCDHPCIPATSFCSTASNLVTCAGSGMSCGEMNTTCTFGCNLTRDECNACNPGDPNVCTGSTAIVCDTVAPGEGTITTMSTCSYACDAGGNLCFFPDTCASPYVVPVPAPPLTYGPATFTGNLSDYGSDVAGSCGEAGDDVIHRIDVPMNGAFTAFSTIVLNTAGSAIETASHITTVCGASANELQHASVVCGASTSSGPTCYDPAGTETLRACGMPTGTYYGTLDSPVFTGAYTLALTVDNVNLDTCAESGNVSNTPMSATITTTGLADNYSFNLTTSASPCTPSSADSECGRPNGAPGGDTTWTCYPPVLPDGPDAVFHYRAAASGFLTVTTLGSAYDTILFIKNACVADCVIPANCLKCNDDHNFSTGEAWSQIYRMAVTAGTLYYIFADGYDLDAGTLVLNVSFSTT